MSAMPRIACSGRPFALGAGCALLLGAALCLPALPTAGGGGPNLLAAPVSRAQASMPADPAVSDFVFPRSSYELLTEAEVDACSSYQLYIARNEIFARHGYIFVYDDLRARFSSMAWYTPLYTEAQFSWSLFNEVEEANIALIQRREAELAGTAQRLEYVFPASSSQLLTEADLRYCTAYELYLARNEIFARHGYIFESADLREHFGSTSWYVPRYTADEFQWEWLSSIEMKNIALIQERESYLAGASAGSGTSGVASGHVAADWISFELPQSWIGYVDVVFSQTNGAPSVTVSYRGNPDMVLVSFYRVDASTQINAGDIGSGLVSWWDDGRGHRIEMWGRNYVFQTQTLGTAAYPNAYVEAALIDLSTGGAYTVETARLSNQGNGSADGYDFYSGAIAPTVSVS